MLRIFLMVAGLLSACATAAAQNVVDAGTVSPDLPGPLSDDREFLKAQNACFRPALDEVCQRSSGRRIVVAVSMAGGRPNVEASNEVLQGATRETLRGCLAAALENAKRKRELPPAFTYAKTAKCSQ